MKQSNGMLSQRESYAPTKWTEFLWWLATTEKEIIQECVIDRNRYAIVGSTVLCTWLFASMAWTYFFSLVVTQPLVYVALGLFMGFIILCIDRALIKGITGKNKLKAAPFVFRLILATTIGTFMAQPALLYLFKQEIKQQVSLDQEFKKSEKLQKQVAVYALQKENWQQQKQTLQKELAIKYAEVAKARESFIAETDGTGGSKKIGLEAIAKTKKQAYETLQKKYELDELIIAPKITQADSALLAIEQSIAKEQHYFANNLSNGFLTQIEALNNLIKTNTTLQYRYWLLIVLLLLIELMPIIAKSILPIGSYDKKVIGREQIEEETIQSNTQKEIELKELYNQLAFEKDKEFIENFFKQTKEARLEILATETANWKKDTTKSFDSFWKMIKENMLTKQEN